MYHVPSSHTRDPKLRRAIAIAVVLCSLGAVVLAHVLNNGVSGSQAGVFAIVAYFVLILGCEFATDRLWTRGLYGLALGGLLLGLVCVAFLPGNLLYFVPSVPQRWDDWNNLSGFALVLLIAPIHIRRLWARAERQAEADSADENEED